MAPKRESRGLHVDPYDRRHHFDDGTGNDNATIIGAAPATWKRRARDQPIERTRAGKTKSRCKRAAAHRQARPAAAIAETPDLTVSLVSTICSRSRRSTRRTSWSSGSRQGSPAPVANAAKADPGVKKSGGLDIDESGALGDVLLTSPGKTSRAETRRRVRIADSDGRRRRPEPPAGRLRPANANGKPGDKPAEKPAERPEEPETRAIADRIWAKCFSNRLIRPRPTRPRVGRIARRRLGRLAGRDRIVFLRGSVRIHQDPKSAKTRHRYQGRSPRRLQDG